MQDCKMSQPVRKLDAVTAPTKFGAFGDHFAGITGGVPGKFGMPANQTAELGLNRFCLKNIKTRGEK